MGYNTYFILNMRDNNTKKAITQDNPMYFQIMSAFNDVYGTNDILEDLTTGIEDKWYEWEEDMKNIAKRFPTVRFKLEGQGEDQEDWWVATFLGEKFQLRKAKLISPYTIEEEF